MAITDVDKEDTNDLENLMKLCQEKYNSNEKVKKEWGGGKLGIKSQHKIEKVKKALEIEKMRKEK